MHMESCQIVLYIYVMMHRVLGVMSNGQYNIYANDAMIHKESCQMVICHDPQVVLTAECTIFLRHDPKGFMSHIGHMTSTGVTLK